TPYALALFYDDISSAGWMGVVELLPRLAIIQATYIGFFVLPIAIAALPGVSAVRPRGWRVSGVLAWACLVIGGAISYWLDGQKAMPYVGQFVTATGIGPEDLIAARPVLMQPPERVALTVLCVVASVLFAAAVLRQRRLGTALLVVLAVAVGQVVGTIPSSVHFIAWSGTLDRYLLPLLPMCILLLLAALPGIRASLALAWVAVIVMGAWSVAGTRDHLAFVDGIWSLATQANGMGIDDLHLDAGAGWDGFHDYAGPPDPAVRPRTPNPQWWAELFAPRTDSSYVIAGEGLRGYAVVAQGGYYSWLRQEWMPLYLLRRPGVAGPP
ncbi:MAG: hypothetical protein JOZ81_05470, partial [Chloroflexi bacterium]|nr:hypothetical protein [Chloroflexota bacterium]